MGIIWQHSKRKRGIKWFISFVSVGTSWWYFKLNHFCGFSGVNFQCLRHRNLVNNCWVNLNAHGEFLYFLKNIKSSQRTYIIRKAERIKNSDTKMINKVNRHTPLTRVAPSGVPCRNCQTNWMKFYKSKPWPIFNHSSLIIYSLQLQWPGIRRSMFSQLVGNERLGGLYQTPIPCDQGKETETVSKHTLQISHTVWDLF